MSRTVALANQKGGVGKTTTAINLGASLAACERKVLIIDLDPQANATSGLGVGKNEPQSMYQVLVDGAPLKDAIRQTELPTLWIAPSSVDLVGAEMELGDAEKREFRLREVIKPVQHAYDFILIDSPPSLGLLTINGLTAADSVLVPLQCEYFALEGVSQLLNTVERVRESLNPDLQIEGIALTMYDDRMNLARQVAEEVRNHFGAKVYKTVIPRNVRLGEAPSFGKPIILYDIRSRGSEAYVSLAKEFIARAEGAASMNQKKVLGRGLGALIPQRSEPAASTAGLAHIAIDQISPNPYQPRRVFNEASIEELARSVREHGIVQPLVVTRSGDRYQLIAGERRFRAAQRAGLKVVPAVVKELTQEGDALQIALIENIQREDLNPIEEAVAYGQLHEEFSLTQEEISRRVGKERSTVANFLRLLKLPDAVKKLLASGQLSMGHARALLAVDSARKQEQLAERVVKRALNVRQTEVLAAATSPKASEKRTKDKDVFTRDAEEKLTRTLRTKVEIDRKRRGGVIHIRFTSEDDLIRIFDELSGRRR